MGSREEVMESFLRRSRDLVEAARLLSESCDALIRSVPALARMRDGAPRTGATSPR